MSTIQVSNSPTAHAGANGDPLEVRLGAIFGTSRSGSTWLGAIVASHPDTAYRFEPFHRAKITQAREIKRLTERILAPDFNSTDLREFYDFLLAADPWLYKPPFFKNDHHVNFGRHWLWVACRTVPALGGVFKAIYRARGRPYVIFKEVNFERVLGALVHRSTIPVIYLARHPCAFVASQISGQSMGFMLQRQYEPFRARLLSDHPDLVDRFANQLEEMTPAQFIALRWRVEVESAFAQIDHHPRVLLVFHEQLCRDPLKISNEVFNHLGLAMCDQTLDFIKASTTERDAPPRSVKTRRRAYFNVYRDPMKSMDKWKTELNAEQRAQIDAIVSDSRVFQECAALADWAPIR